MKLISFLKMLLAASSLFLGWAMPSFAQSINVQGRVTNSAGQVITGASTIFRIQILTPNSNLCVLYDETQTVDLAGTNGLFSINLNNGSGTVNSPTTYTLDQAVSNATGFAVNSQYCQTGSGTVTYLPAATDNRKVVIQFKDPGSMSAFESIPAMDLNPVAYAMEGRTVGGYPASALLRVADAGVIGTAATLTSANFTELQNLINGTSNNYMSSSSNSTGARLPGYSSTPASPTAGSIWYDTSSGTIQFYNGSTTQSLGTSSANGTITGITTSAPLSGSGTTGSVNISLASSGVTAGSYGGATSIPVLTVDAFGRVTAASTATVSGVAPGGAAGGDLAGSYPSPTVAKLQGIAIGTTAPSSGEFFKYNGTNWAGAVLGLSDIKATDNSNVVANGSCSANQTLFIDGTGHFNCQGVGTLDASAITTGTLAAGLMPAFTGDVTSSAGSTALTLSATGVAANTYKSVTVDAKGRVLAGTNPTTLGGFGITDGVQNTGGLPSMAAGADASKPTPGTAGRLYVASDTFKIYRDNGTGWDLIASAAGSGGTITNVTAGTGLSGGGSTGAITVSMPNVGSVGTYTKVVTDAQGRVASGGTLTASDIPALPWSQITSGKPTTLSGYGITNGVANAGAAISIQAGAAASIPAAGTVGRIYIGTDNNTISYDTGSSWTTITSGTGFTGSLSGDVTGSQSATVVSQVGGVTAANVASGANLANAATNLNTASTIVKRDPSGNFAAGAVSQGSSIFRDLASNTVTLTAPSTVTASYSLTLPAAAASSNGQILSSTTAGVLSWASPSSVFSTSVTAPITNSGTATAPNIGITQATTSASGYLSSADWNTFSAKLSSALTSAYLFIGNASNVATGVALSGDATLTNAGALTVTGIKGKTVSAAPTTAGQVLRYDGTNITPNFLSMADLRSTVTGSSALTTGCTASQTLTWNSGTDNLMCQSISVAAATQITGVLPVANGGTGSATTSQNFVFAGPAGAAGAPSFRALTSADLPASASYWSAATGGINYSGGSVGIGTSAPSTLLDVTTSARYYDAAFRLGPSTLHAVSSNGTYNGVMLANNYDDVSAQIQPTLPSWFLDLGGRGTFADNDAFTIRRSPAGATINASNAPAVFKVTSSGNVGIGTTAPTAALNIKAGTSSIAPLQLTAGTNLTAPLSGAIEYDGSYLYYTDSSSVRHTLAGSASSGTQTFANDVTITGSGTGLVVTNNETVGGTLAVTGATTISNTTPSTSTSTGALIVSGGLGVAGTVNAAIVAAGGGTASAPSHTFTSDLTSGMWQPAASSLAWSTGGTERMRILSNGYVGIGTTSPGYNLSVASSTTPQMALTSTGTSGRTFSLQSTGGTGTALDGDFQLIDRTANAARMTLDGSGNFNFLSNVGIGTTTPMAKLSVANTAGPGANVPNYPFSIITSGTGSSNRVLAADGNRTTYFQVNNSGNYGELATYDYGASTGMNLVLNTNGGNVGIGTTAPVYHLQLESGADNQFQVTGKGTGWGGALLANIYSERNTQGLGNPLLKVSSAYNPSTFVVTDTGTVGIGTTNPDSSLHILPVGYNQSASTLSAIHSTAGNTSNYFGNNQLLMSYSGNTYSHAIKTRHNNTAAAGNDIDFYLWNYGVDAAGAVGSKQVMTLDGTGNVGIGTTNPGQKLHVYSAGASAVDTGIELQNGGTGGATINLLAGNSGSGEPQLFRIFDGTANRIGISSNGSVALQPSSGNVGIGTTAPTDPLTVVGNIQAQGQIYSRTVASAASTTLTYDTNTGNTMSWTTNGTGLTANVQNLKDGGSYTLAVRGTGTDAITFACYSDAGSTALTSSFLPANGPRSGSATIYTLQRIGAYCYISWVTGWN